MAEGAADESLGLSSDVLREWKYHHEQAALSKLTHQMESIGQEMEKDGVFSDAHGKDSSDSIARLGEYMSGVMQSVQMLDFLRGSRAQAAMETAKKNKETSRASAPRGMDKAPARKDPGDSDSTCTPMSAISKDTPKTPRKAPALHPQLVASSEVAMLKALASFKPGESDSEGSQKRVTFLLEEPRHVSMTVGLNDLKHIGNRGCVDLHMKSRKAFLSYKYSSPRRGERRMGCYSNSNGACLASIVPKTLNGTLDLMGHDDEVFGQVLPCGRNQARFDIAGKEAMIFELMDRDRMWVVVSSTHKREHVASAILQVQDGKPKWCIKVAALQDWVVILTILITLTSSDSPLGKGLMETIARKGHVV